MPDLLLELFSEEIPARMQGQAAADLKRLVTDALVERGLVYEGAAAFATPRRLALHVAGLPVRQSNLREEKRGPRVGAPAAAIQGFLKSAGLASLDEARIERDPKGKGDFYVSVAETKGRESLAVLAEVLPEILRNFPWPKSMRWGAASARTDSLRWVRPLHAIVATFGPETEEPEIVRFSLDGLASGDVTYGHRFLAPDAIRVRRFDDYVQALRRAKVVLDPARRRDMIVHDARNLALAQGLELVEDEALLEEVAGLVEWPVVLLGSFDPAFLVLPPEAIRATIRNNQKCFVLKKPDGALADKFLLVSNIEARDGGKAIAAGNARVVRARLSDAKFFYETDLETPLEQRLPKLDAVVFHEKLGAQGERVKRIEALAKTLAPAVGADPEQAARAARLAKADLVTEMVGEFPELQGLMGRYYASAQGEAPAVAAAIEDHYKPQGPSDRVPTAPASIAVALADKLDTLAGFWAIGEKPTGSKDPYALRRAALGVIRIVIENGVRLHIALATSPLFEKFDQEVSRGAGASSLRVRRQFGVFHVDSRALDLLAFFIDRLKIYLREKGARHDLIEAAVGAEGSPSPFETAASRPPQGEEDKRRASSPSPHSEEPRSGVPSSPHPEERRRRVSKDEGPARPQDDLLMIVRRVEALARFLDTDDGRSLLSGYRRATNILRIEEKKDGAGAFFGAHDPALRRQPEEHALAEAIEAAAGAVARRVAAEDFEGAMRALADLRAPVDAFFDRVTVNDADPSLRVNRLRLLSELRRAMRAVADFSKI